MLLQNISFVGFLDKLSLKYLLILSVPLCTASNFIHELTEWERIFLLKKGS